jgi:hypothetical protein
MIIATRTETTTHQTPANLTAGPEAPIAPPAPKTDPKPDTQPDPREPVPTPTFTPREDPGTDPLPACPEGSPDEGDGAFETCSLPAAFRVR